MAPWLPALWIQPRAEDGTCASPTPTRRPASRACASVSPTEPISGSVNVTRGTARSSAGGPSWPRMSRTAMPAWYMAMWVNAPCPVTSPTAHSLSPARIRSSTATAGAPGSSPTLRQTASPCAPAPGPPLWLTTGRCSPSPPAASCAPSINPARLSEQIGPADHHLARNTPPIRALTADQPTLDTHHHQTRLRHVRRRSGSRSSGPGSPRRPP